MKGQVRLEHAAAFVGQYEQEGAVAEVTAIMALEGALYPLSGRAKVRVLRWALARFDIEEVER